MRGNTTAAQRRPGRGGGTSSAASLTAEMLMTQIARERLRRVRERSRARASSLPPLWGSGARVYEVSFEPHVLNISAASRVFLLAAGYHFGQT